MVKISSTFSASVGCAQFSNANSDFLPHVLSMPKSATKKEKSWPVRLPSTPTPPERPKARPQEKPGYRSSPLSIQPQHEGQRPPPLQAGRE